MASFELSDELLGAVVPIVVYWVYAAMYAALGSRYTDKYRLHTKQDEDEKNVVTKGEVIRAVLRQHFLQFLAAMFLYRVTGGTGESTRQPSSFIDIAKQFVIAMLVLDTYQYFCHRFLFHNKYLYRYLHARHHRLIVPYTFGAIYCNPLEGFLSDTIGGSLTFLLSGMTPRTSIFFFSFATIKNVDDHCGMMLPGNPFHFFFRNNAAYHDLHHQLYGGKYNFSVPFFTIWDRILGTDLPYSLAKRAEGGLEARPNKDCKEN